MARRKILALLSCLVLGQVHLANDEPAPSLATDSRLERAVTLEDYHPWSPYLDHEAWHARAQRVRQQILVAAGLWPMPPKLPLEPVIHGSIDRGDYTVEKVYFQSYPGFYVTGNLYRPKAKSSAPRPGVLCPHGHWQNGRFYERGEAEANREIQSGGESNLAGGRYPLQARCAMLARMGCVVFMYDMVGNADSRQIHHAQGFRDAEAALRLESAFGLQTFNSIRALDFITSLEGVDPLRIAVTGASGGGTQTFVLCAIDDRPAVAFPAVMVSTSMQGGCVCENAPLLRIGTGNVEFAALMAPRPLGMTGAHDWTIDIETKGLPELKKLYASLGAADLVDARCYPHFEHNYNEVSRERMYAWLNRHLRLGVADPVYDSIPELSFEPIPPKDLSVWDAEHPMPANAVDSVKLRQTMSEASDAQMANLTQGLKDGPGLAEYRSVVGTALRVIISSEVLSPEQHLLVSSTARRGEAKGKPLGVESVILSRAQAGEAVPALWIAPESWNGTAVVMVSERGKAGVATVDEAGKVSGPAVGALELGAAVLAPDVFLTGELVRKPNDLNFPVDAPRHGEYCGYTFGYNRTPLANRVHDVLTAVGYAWSKPGTHTVHLVGTGEAGLWVLLAKAMAGDRVTRTFADRPAFDFTDVKDANDLRFLPGGVKYGGWAGLAALAAPGQLWLRGDGEVPAVLFAAYRAAGQESRLKVVPKTHELEGISAELIH